MTNFYISNTFTIDRQTPQTSTLAVYKRLC
jgi:hypothetical protein